MARRSALACFCLLLAAGESALQSATLDALEGGAEATKQWSTALSRRVTPGLRSRQRRTGGDSPPKQMTTRLRINCAGGVGARTPAWRAAAGAAVRRASRAARAPTAALPQAPAPCCRRRSMLPRQQQWCHSHHGRRGPQLWPRSRFTSARRSGAAQTRTPVATASTPTHAPNTRKPPPRPLPQPLRARRATCPRRRRRP